MKSVAPEFQDHLDSGATTLCWCWRLRRRDGSAMGFTDHDRDLQFDGTTFEAAAGFTASEIKDSVGLSVDNLEVTSALRSDRITEADLAAGLFDDAGVEIFRVNWQNPESRILMRNGSLGEVGRSGNAFTAEVRGLAHYLQQPCGRLFQYTCDADLGDARCNIDLQRPDLATTGAIVAVIDGRRLVVEGFDAFAADWFTRGLLTMMSGEAAGQAAEVKRHFKSGGAVTIELWQPARTGVVAGDAVRLQAGCDKHLATCRDKFANAANYRGFPHMPGNDFVTSYVRR